MFFYMGAFFITDGIFPHLGANVLVEFENVFLIGGIFFTIGGIFLKLGAKNYFGIEKISYFWNYIDPWYQVVPFCTLII